jgi:hypothetical protein
VIHPPLDATQRKAALVAGLMFSRYVPWPLAAWGLLTYATMIVYSCAKLVVPSLAAHDLIVYTPAGIFEIVIGCWLVAIGVRANSRRIGDE